MSELPDMAISRIEELIRNAGNLILKSFKRDTRISFERKADRSPVTKADLEAQVFLEEGLKTNTPDIPVFGEEHSIEEYNNKVARGNPEVFWIVDPIDGTQNYMLGIDFFCVSVGLVQHRKIVIGIIYDPVRDEMFSARVCGGAFLNGKPIRSNGKKQYSDYMFCVQLRWMSLPMRRYVADFLAGNVDRIREAGSTALKLAWIACGRYDADLQAQVNFWDSAAGILIVKEAGGICTDFHGNQIDISPNGQHELCAGANKHVHQWIIDSIKMYVRLED